MTMQFNAWYWGSDMDSYAGFLENNQRRYGCNFRVPQTPQLREKCIQGYTDHIEEVKRTISPERLLVYNVKEGWEPLCKFLEVPVPTLKFPKRDITKPNPNETWAQLWQDIQDDAITDSMWMVLKPTMILWGSFWLFGCCVCCCLCRCFCRCLCGRSNASAKAGKSD